MLQRFALTLALMLAPVAAQAQTTADVVITTDLGAITVALETERAPISAGNFLRYVDQKRFDGTVFYLFGPGV